ncbi:MAG: sulfur oxidation c-type cytochrome SoxX [Gammaproteobacteria bacterium]|nr:sulfur oxidation c-type cytochrome SoxX [Gammaproteobacteria bacterium]MCP5407505.1 sulfur oxidation c-type cytochrome SoxX [Chromatiaceae bacterium]MCP5441777.1 sulfur oxidation c-type cytochrome SoxX [Chromatiaceae bacterium]
MTKYRKSLASLVGTLTLLTGTILTVPTVNAVDGASNIEKGKAIAFGRTQGNCLTCHVMDNGESPGNLGPPLIAMKARFPDKAKLRAQIWDPTVANPESAMVPFGKHKVLTEEEIDYLVDYIWTL